MSGCEPMPRLGPFRSFVRVDHGAGVIVKARSGVGRGDGSSRAEPTVCWHRPVPAATPSVRRR